MNSSQKETLALTASQLKTITGGSINTDDGASGVLHLPDKVLRRTSITRTENMVQ